MARELLREILDRLVDCTRGCEDCKDAKHGLTRLVEQWLKFDFIVPEFLSDWTQIPRIHKSSGFRETIFVTCTNSKCAHANAISFDPEAICQRCGIERGHHGWACALVSRTDLVTLLHLHTTDPCPFCRMPVGVHSTKDASPEWMLKNRL